MTETPDSDRIAARSRLLPEEQAAGSDDERRAEVVLEDSDARTADPEGTKHDSAQTPERDDH